jgi:hypothetical protein
MQTQSLGRSLCDAGVRREGNESTDRSVVRSGAWLCEVRRRARCGYTLACNADCDASLYLYRPQPVRVETCPAPRLGCTGGARLFRGQAPFPSVLRLDRVETSDLSFSAIRPQYAGCRLKSQDESSPVVFWRWSAGSHRPQSGSGDLVPAGGGGTVERGKDPLGHACDSVAPDPGDPRAERLLGQRPGKGAAELSGPWQCQRHRTFGQQGSIAAGSWTTSTSVFRSHCRRTSRSRPFSGSPPARRLIDSAPRRWSRRTGRDRNPWGLTFDDGESAAR